MKIVIDDNIPFINGRIPNVEILTLPAGKICRDTVIDADALMVRTRTRCDASLLEGSKVKIVATATIGLDHIDIPWCESHGITVKNAPGCNAPGVAVYVWSTLLHKGFKPSSSTIGVIGCGNVGSIVAQWGKRLGAKVLVCDPPRAKAGYTDHDYLPMEEVMRRSDAITIHTPLTLDGECPTFHMINAKTLQHLKNGAIFVNAARGEVAETHALRDAIESGHISKAIIDTWEHEPDIDPILLNLADVATCHIAGYSVQGKQRATRMALEAVGRCLGIPVNTGGLQGPYTEPQNISPELIMEKFDPAPLSATLKSRGPAAFESLRNSYLLHTELL